MTKIKWSKRKLKALQGSIEKWEKIVDGTGLDFSSENCPLCQIYYYCRSCPIEQTTGKRECGGTPWYDWNLHHFEKHRDSCPHISQTIECPTCKKLAKKELAFLKSLLPKEEQI